MKRFSPKNIKFYSARIVLLIATFLCINTAQAQLTNINLSRGINLYQQGAYEQAIAVLNEAIQENPNNIDAYIYLASSYLGVQQYEQVATTAQRGLKNNPQHIRLMLLEAEANYRTDYRKAIPIYQKIAGMLKDGSAKQKQDISVDQINAYLGHLYQRSANDLYKTGNYNDAITAYKKARKVSPDSLNIHNNLAYTLLQQERWEEAIEVLETATQKFPDSEQLLFMKGQAYQGAGQPEKMVEVYKTLHERDKENLNYAIIYGQSLMAANRAQEANAFLNKLIRDNPKEERLYEVLKKMNEQRFDFQAKRNILELQRKAFPENAAVAVELAETNIQTKQYSEARQIYDSLATAANNYQYNLASARTWLYAENYQKADSVYRSLVQVHPGEVQVLVEASKVAEKVGSDMRALTLLEKAYSLEQKPETALDIARISEAAGDNAKTLQFAEKLKGTDYSGIGTLYKLKYADKEEAISTSKMALSLVKMLQLFESKQQKLSGKADKTLQTMQIGLPPLLHESQRLEQFSYYIDEWYNYLIQKFSTQQSLDIMDDVRSIYNKSPRLHFFEGKLLMQDKSFVLALSSFQEAARQNPGDPEVYYWLGEAYLELENLSQAILSYERALTVEPVYENAYRKIIQISQEQGSLNQVCDRWMRRYNNNKNNSLLREYLILALHKADRNEDAAVIIEN